MLRTRIFCIALLAGVVFSAEGREVTLKYNGIVLSAELELAVGKHISDGVILITHGGLAHRDMESMVHFRELLQERGYSTLSINLSLGINYRKGMFDCSRAHRHQHTDAVDEIEVWVKWLTESGAPHIILLGHSRGGGQTALYAAERSDARIKAVVLLAPQTNENGGAGYAQRYGVPLAPTLMRAQELVMAGKPDTVLDDVNMLFCRGVRATAASFISYYAPDPRLDTPTLLPHIRVPVLVVVAGADTVVKNLAQKIHQAVSEPGFQITVIPGADHMFRDLYADDAIDEVHAFLSTLSE